MRERKREGETDRETQADRHTDRDTNAVFTRLSSGLRNYTSMHSSSPDSMQVALLTDLSTHVKRLTGMRANSSPSKLTTIT